MYQQSGAVKALRDLTASACPVGSWHSEWHGLTELSIDVPHLLCSVHNALSHNVTPHDSSKYVDQQGFDLLIRCQQLESLDNLHMPPHKASVGGAERFSGTPSKVAQHSVIQHVKICNAQLKVPGMKYEQA